MKEVESVKNPEETVDAIVRIPKEQYSIIKSDLYDTFPIGMKKWGLEAIRNGTLIPAGHGRIVDLGKIDKDRIDSNNPVISLMIGGEYIEAVSLDYLNDLDTIVEADKTVG